MKAYLFVIALCTSVFPEPQMLQLNRYLDLLHSHSSTFGFPGEAQKNELELINDPLLIEAAMKKTGRDVGILYEDKYWIWVNDPLLFPNGNVGVYGRILFQSSLSGSAGCAVLPRLPDGRFVLNCNFRHATRTWELEIPRGISEKGETPEESATRELLEETGFVARRVHFLGKMPSDTGLSNAVTDIFLAEINQAGEATPEESEAIASIIPFTLQELRIGLYKGLIQLEIEGEIRDVFLRDPFLIFALFQMDLRKRFSQE